jgi:hypothetical protein
MLIHRFDDALNDKKNTIIGQAVDGYIITMVTVVRPPGTVTTLCNV